MATIGTLVLAQAQDTTTTTGTGALTLTNAVPAGAPAGSTTFAVGLASQVTSPGYPINNIFYYISDGTNVEVGLGTLTSATNLTRDFVLLNTSSGVQTVTGGHVNFASGTKNIYSNPTLFANTVALWERFPNQTGGNDGGITEDIMSGTFTAGLTINSVAANMTVRYKVSSAGIVALQFPATTQNQAGTAVTITGIPAFLSNVTTGSFLILIVVNSVNTVGVASLAGGATPASTGTITLSQLAGTAPFSITAVWTASQPNGVQAQSVLYPLF